MTEPLASGQNELLRLQRMHNGAKVTPTFSAAEMSRRQDGLRHSLADLRLDAALLTSYHNINYFSDFLYCSFGRRYAFVVSAHRATSISAGIDAGQPWRRTFGDNITYTDWRKDNFFYALQGELQGARRIGIEFDHVSVDLFRQLQDALPGVELVNIGQATMWMRTIKSEEEIALIKAGARTADLGGAAIRDAIREGVGEHEVALAGTQAMVRHIAETFPYAELMDTWVWFQSGINTDGAHNPVTSRRLRRGDILSLNCFPMIAGYYTALERTLFLDHCDEASRRIWEVNVKVHRRGLDILRPGARCGDIAAELNEIYRSEGLLGYRSFGYGHSFGVLSHYYGREAGVELREDVHTVLKPGMVVSMEPMLTIPEGMPGAGGYREHDILVLTETGAENITGFPFGPEHNIVPA
ncbi:M24 family metallopeptidase [Methylobacterium ajmalii]|uniref:M24 family metallopeptidase n=1 Tax=Methylobacterium ajmalii TaxID=2738439 RepID=UPI00190C8588|nr:M24 family metallopeptidase [Methylobacterium ajmalii]MBK3400886.1 M24 family metallopeptidase [Methylobacterium ajmalii]MBK3410961.1 M24 family metallopeptidase [Methylobacterium ajmalii]MBK3423808.1 M24 family metallopeptidase [Methylobacterium ajmalii]MBZ6415729.1 M24 family metallopeptidase [Methylobacterium sp.]